MINNARTWLLRRKWMLAAVALPVVIALWWAFRPEKLWINQKVNEAAPFDANNEPQPILTARFNAKAQQTSGRATVYKRPGGGEYLRLSDFTGPSGSDIHVLLARSDDPIVAEGVADGQLQDIDCGPLKSNQSEQDFDLPMATDLKQYEAVVFTVKGLKRYLERRSSNRSEDTFSLMTPGARPTHFRAFFASF
jgi:hypothetical protein